MINLTQGMYSKWLSEAAKAINSYNEAITTSQRTEMLKIVR